MSNGQRNIKQKSTILAIIFACFDRDYIINQFKKQVPKKWIQKASEIYKETWSVSLNYINLL